MDELMQKFIKKNLLEIQQSGESIKELSEMFHDILLSELETCPHCNSINTERTYNGIGGYSFTHGCDMEIPEGWTCNDCKKTFEV